jgi:isocitrate/isopropylmalate dehydrogenase
MIPGDGIGPEISQSVKDIFSTAGVNMKDMIIFEVVIFCEI